MHDHVILSNSVLHIEVVLASPVTVMPAFISAKVVLMAWEASVRIDKSIKKLGLNCYVWRIEDRMDPSSDVPMGRGGSLSLS